MYVDVYQSEPSDPAGRVQVETEVAPPKKKQAVGSMKPKKILLEDRVKNVPAKTIQGMSHF